MHNLSLLFRSDFRSNAWHHDDVVCTMVSHVDATNSHERHMKLMMLKQACQVECRYTTVSHSKTSKHDSRLKRLKFNWQPQGFVNKTMA